MTTPPWRSLLEKVLSHEPRARFAQLATLRADGRPANRTVTFRAFASADRLLFTTDTRSTKVEPLARHPCGELCWYFAQARVQFRLAGIVSLAAAEARGELARARLRIWREGSDAFRLSFVGPAPGSLHDGEPAAPQTNGGEPPPHFALLLLEPDEVDVLELGSTPHRRVLFQRRDDQWFSARLNP